MDEAYTFDFGDGDQQWETENEISETKNETNETKSETNETKSETKVELSEREEKILSLIIKNPQITQKKLQEETGISLGTIKRLLPALQEKGVIERIGNRRSGKWNIRKADRENGI